MNYEFPYIQNIDDVLPHIEGFDEIIVAEREGYKVINYMVSMPKTFVMEGPDDHAGAIRRECRGLIFCDRTGRLLSRPFHKFFNVNEKEETQDHLIDLSKPHVIMEKMDGSMIRPLILNKQLYLATKMGVTDVAKQAQAILTQEQYDWLYDVATSGMTPLLEFVAPDNKIVVKYVEAKLVLLGIRNNLTGSYYLPHISPFEVVKTYGDASGGAMKDFIAAHRDTEGREGDIIRFADGHMLKIKNDWYVRIHKTLDLVRTDRNVIDLMLNEDLDDRLPTLDAEDRARVEKLVDDFWALFEGKLNYLKHLVDMAEHEFGMDRKRIALEMQAPKKDKSFIFGVANGRDLREELLKKAKGAMGTGTNYEKLLAYFREV